MVETISAQTVSEFEEEIKRARVVLLEFFAIWCGPCQFIAPALEEMEKEFVEQYPPVDDVNQFAVLKVDVDQCMAVADELGVGSMPTFHIYNEGKLVETMIGTNQSKINAICKDLLSCCSREQQEAVNEEEATEPVAAE